MAMQWTKEQEQVIRLENRNILVSAAAGSGKTAVLVERILQKMIRKENPIDIDRLLIVTFTRAAAGEMRERLTAAVEKMLESDPDNEHLQRQQTLIHNAQITTIDGFCSYVIRNYFHTIDLDPGFRTANEGELKLLKHDVARELLEQNYAEATPEFQRFAEVFASGKSDDGLMELILNLYEFSMSNPWPLEWLDVCAEPYQAETFETLAESRWMQCLWEDVDRSIEEAKLLIDQMAGLAAAPDGPKVYQEALEQDEMLQNALEQAVRKRDFDSCVRQLQNLKFKALSRKKDPDASELKKEAFKKTRDNWKEMWKSLRERYFLVDSEQVMKQIALCREPVEELVALTKSFAEAFGARKRQKNIVDFTDMEHFALQILVRKEDGQLIYTPAAEEFSDRFSEILIDEYQDSNLVQETLLQAVSRMRRGQNNMFMVGDVKQSIYRFRLARPELFMEKYDTYSKEEDVCQRIDLHKNFRSRPVVLAGVNYLFRQMMGRDLGQVEYDAEAALYPGAEFPEDSTGFTDTEVLLIQTDTGELEDVEEADQEVTAQELEARLIGKRILEIVGKEQITDKATGTWRPVEYRDCVILLRTISGWAETFVRVLMDMGIPAYATSRTGYFSTLEVTTLLNYLRICDNPRQEIPFTGVLLSPLAGCTARELALMKMADPDHQIYDCARSYHENGEDPVIRSKLEIFFRTYEQIREQVPYTPIHELIQQILLLTGYDRYAAAMPGGEQRLANLQMLVEKAMEYEKTSYRGLFNFLRYIEGLQKYQVDFGEMNTIGEMEDTVRIMSIHKSKGLEFPVVFVSGMGKRINMMDVNAGMVIHQELGIGVLGIDPELRLKTPVLMRQVIQKQIRLESLGEELRVLYVALTRAREKLILTGTISRLEKRMMESENLKFRKEERLPYGIREGVQDYWGWILPALAKREMSDAALNVQTYTASQLLGDALLHQISEADQREHYISWDPEKIYDEEIRRHLETVFSYEYPKSYLQEIPAKLSVSQLKKEQLEGEESHELYPDTSRESIIPAFMGTEKQELKGAARGTAYHRVMELLDYGRTDSREQIQEQMDEMREQELIDADMERSVQAEQIYRFVCTDLGQRMKKAAFRQQLHREQQFVMSIPAKEKNPEWGDQDQILVQGIIDAYFEEADQLILVDYKTDYVQKGQEEELVRKYRVQLEYYAEALRRGQKKNVKEGLIYSFTLGKVLPVF